MGVYFFLLCWNGAVVVYVIYRWRDHKKKKRMKDVGGHSYYLDDLG